MYTCTLLRIQYCKEKISSTYKIVDLNLNKIVHIYDLGETLYP